MITIFYYLGLVLASVGIALTPRPVWGKITLWSFVALFAAIGYKYFHVAL